MMIVRLKIEQNLGSAFFFGISPHPTHILR